ncbi:MAG: PqiA/YebS family transporter subunit [Desulfobulbaceae bacterium]|jgi:paraquat-inducible protein A|nr:PqiA/YebS family transporter subunit [Desulfobulbaceae bacterium]
MKTPSGPKATESLVAFMNAALSAQAAAGYQACPQCDLLFIRVEPKPGNRARCPRCGCVVASSSDSPALTTLLLCLTGIILYFPTIISPILSMSILWMKQSGTVLESVAGLFQADYPLVSLAVLLMVVVFPALVLICLGIVALSIRIRRVGRRTALLFRLALALEEWAMVDVFLVGILVMIFKMTGSVEMKFDGGFLACLALALTLISLSTVCEHRLFWRRIDHRNPGWAPAPALQAPAVGTASEAGLILCLACQQLQKPAAVCTRCGSPLRERRKGSLGTCWALLLTATIFMFPANLLPIMEVESLRETTSSTIIDGILFFFEEGNYLVGMIILVASVFVPVLKIIALATLLATAQGWNLAMLREKTALYRFISLIGRWSMLDIFVIALLNAMVQFGMLSSVRVAPAATWFCLVVTTTMLATHFFDPRLMWDAASRRSRDE